MNEIDVLWCNYLVSSCMDNHELICQQVIQMEWRTAEHSPEAFLSEKALTWVSVLRAAPRSNRTWRKSFPGILILLHPGWTGTRAGKCCLEERKGVWQAECNHRSFISSGKQAWQNTHRQLFLEGYFSVAARSLKKSFHPLELLLLYSLGIYVHIEVLL